MTALLGWEQDGAQLQELKKEQRAEQDGFVRGYLRRVLDGDVQPSKMALCLRQVPATCA